jgi:aminopeptidase N
MKWWNDLWLNEGFANYIEYVGTDHYAKEWRVVSYHDIFSSQNSAEMVEWVRERMNKAGEICVRQKAILLKLDKALPPLIIELHANVKTTDHFCFQLDQFAADTFQSALAHDSIINTHAISVPVDNPSQINEIFDSISYDKVCVNVSHLSR